MVLIGGKFMRQLFPSKFRVTQEFGVNADYYKKFGLKGHEGLDLVPTGSVWDVFALDDGVVVKDDDIAGEPKADVYGIFATIWHPALRKATQYCHLKVNFVSNGQQVKRGDKIGVMGSSGNTQGIHVHLNLFNTDVNGVRLNKDNGFLGGIDPLPFLNEATVPPETTALDECKRQLTDEIKKKDDTWKELQEVKADLAAAQGESASARKQYSDFLIQLSRKLMVQEDPTIVLGQIEKLLKEEDQLAKVQKDLQAVEKKFSLQEQEKNLLEQAKVALEQVNKQQTSMIETMRTDAIQMEKELADCKAAAKFKIVAKVLGLYIAVDAKEVNPDS